MMQTCSKHARFQNVQFVGEDNMPLEGQRVFYEDDMQRKEENEGFDESTAKYVIYNFRYGYIHSDEDEPAIQYAGHYEIWDSGQIQKVVADGGNREEYWESCKLVRVEKNLAARRAQEELYRRVCNGRSLQG
ncbi:MAG: hypothetical protein HUK25_04220 [Treponema sp.]|nr:hypothetical protein [Treponema sp.]